MACDSDNRFAVTNPTSITVVTEEDWMMAVTTVPVTRPMNRLVVSVPRIWRILSPATSLRASPIWSMPNRNRARPPARRDRVLSVFMIFSTGGCSWIRAAESCRRVVDTHRRFYGELITVRN